MVIGRITYCDYCNEACFPDDFTTIQIEASGALHTFSFHNRNESDCLAKKLKELHEQFAPQY
jgi:hypothetical protein